MIDSYLRSESDLDDHVVHLLFSANRWELAYVPSIYSFALITSPVLMAPISICRSSMEQTLKSGTYIICDRYAFSGIAFTASKPSQIPYEWCRTPDISLPAPDLTLYLDISPETAKERGGYGEERYEKEELQRRVREMFHRMRNETMTASSGDQDSSTDATDALRWVEIDAGGTMEDVTKAIWDHVEPLIQPGGIMKPISRLWMNHLSSPDSLNKELQKQQ